MITTAVIALAATATTAQIQSRTAYGPYSPWTDGVAIGTASPSAVTVKEGAVYTINVIGSDYDEYIEITNRTVPPPVIKQLGNWKAIVGWCESSASTGGAPAYLNGSNASVTMRYTRTALTFNLPAASYPVYRTESYFVADAQTDPNSPNYVLWDSNEDSTDVAVTILKK